MAKAPRVSPLHTGKQEEERKQAEVARLGKDSDGAYRVNNRIDGGKK